MNEQQIEVWAAIVARARTLHSNVAGSLGRVEGELEQRPSSPVLQFALKSRRRELAEFDAILAADRIVRPGVQ